MQLSTESDRVTTALLCIPSFLDMPGGVHPADVPLFCCNAEAFADGLHWEGLIRWLSCKERITKSHVIYAHEYILVKIILAMYNQLTCVY